MTPEAIHKTSDVYGIQRDIPLNYVSRKTADDALIENLTRDKHLVIFGSSKQGKTSLRKNCLPDSDYVVVHCSNRWALDDLHTAILKVAGYELTQSTTKTTSGKSKVSASLKGGFPGLGAKVGSETADEKIDAVTTKPIDIDPSDVNDIIAALKGFDRYIVLEDFHYLTVET
ncbi:hypothetical protein [Pseudoxanthomonas winnipegensis]|uniref:hypothetical protein n=1 Tax=Pseudoxanthomonas winnipegensis TaxID=2480810 RepID=UPI0019810F16|nr:hypothetical protein [Pseudoxanthomonas winnipegensis]